MKKPDSYKRKRWRIALLTAVVVFLTAILILAAQAGTFLVKTDSFRKADAMILLMGSIPDRVLEAADLYKERKAGKLIIVEEYMGAFLALESKGVHIISNTQQCRSAAIALGIPPDSITVLPGFAQSTQEEALIVRQYLNSKTGIKAITLVSSSCHTRRAAWIFSKAFEKASLPVTVYSSPSRYTQYSGIAWWKHKEEIQVVIQEYVKMLDFLLFDIHKL